MKKTVVVLSAAALLASVVHTRDASANMATDIGAKVAEKVASAVLGEVGSKLMGKIFGTGPDPLTLAQVETAINSAFAKAAVKDVKGDRNGLMNEVRRYTGSRAQIAPLA